MNGEILSKCLQNYISGPARHPFYFWLGKIASIALSMNHFANILLSKLSVLSYHFLVPTLFFPILVLRGMIGNQWHRALSLDSLHIKSSQFTREGEAGRETTGLTKRYDKQIGDQY